MPGTPLTTSSRCFFLRIRILLLKLVLFSLRGVLNSDPACENRPHDLLGFSVSEVPSVHEQAPCPWVNTPRSENHNIFINIAQEKAVTRGGQRGALQLAVSFPYS
jgi:hypothetical protein